MCARSIGYWILALVLIGFGFLSLFSIGGPLLLTGLAMVAVGPWRRRRDVLWPALVAAWSFALAYVLVAPLGCTSTWTAVPAGPSTVGHASCTNVLGRLLGRRCLPGAPVARRPRCADGGCGRRRGGARGALEA